MISSDWLGCKIREAEKQGQIHEVKKKVKYGIKRKQNKGTKRKKKCSKIDPMMR